MFRRHLGASFGFAIRLLAIAALVLSMVQLRNILSPPRVQDTNVDVTKESNLDVDEEVTVPVAEADLQVPTLPPNYNLTTWVTTEFHVLDQQQSDERVREGRIATCIMGQMRTLYTDWQVQRIIDEVLEPFQSDAFLVVSPDPLAYEILRTLEEINGTRIVSDGTLEKRTLLYSDTFRVLSLEEVEKRFSAKAVRLYGGRPSSKENHTCKHKSYDFYHASFWTLKSCHELVTNHEKANNFTYDWIVKQRTDVSYGFWPETHPKRRTQAVVPPYPKRFPDVEIHDTTPRVFGSHGWQSGCMFCDMFHLVSRSAFDAYAGVSDAYRDCSQTVKVDKKGFSCHCHDKKKWDKVTDGKTLECFWMRWLWQNNVQIHLNGGHKDNRSEWTRGCAFDLFLGTAGVIL